MVCSGCAALETHCSYAVGVLFERITVTLLEGPTVVSQVRKHRVEQSSVLLVLTKMPPRLRIAVTR